MAASRVDKILAEWLKVSMDVLAKCDNNPNQDVRQADLMPLSKILFDFSDKGLPDQTTTDVCNRLILMYRCPNLSLRLWVTEFIPSLVWSYLSNITNSTKQKSTKSIEACLLTLYNLSVRHGQALKEPSVITIPSIGKPSLYHEPSSHGAQVLTESALSSYDQGEKKLLIRSFPLTEKLNAKNRFSILIHLMQCYSKDIGQFSHSSHKSLCDLAIRLCLSGFDTYFTQRLFPQNDPILHRPRIITDSEFLCEILSCVYFIMFNGQPGLGLEALECIHQRAKYELYSNVLLMTNAIKNSLVHNPSGQPQNGPMGVSIAITPACLLSSLQREAITNASFKAQKLPDDITPEEWEDAVSDSEGDAKTEKSAERTVKILSGIKLGGSLKSALKKVEKSIKKSGHDHKEDSPGRHDKSEGHTKTVRTHSKLAKVNGNNHETSTTIIEADELDQITVTNDRVDIYYPPEGSDSINIVIDPPSPSTDEPQITTTAL